MAAGSHFGCQKITSYHFKSIPQFSLLWFFYKMTAGGHFECPKLTFDRISIYWPKVNLYQVVVGQQIDRSAILDVWNSLSIAILPISGRYRINFFRRTFWVSENHFRSHFWPFQIDRPFWMSEIHFRWYFRSIRKWPPAAILDVRK